MSKLLFLDTFRVNCKMKYHIIKNTRESFQDPQGEWMKIVNCWDVLMKTFAGSQAMVPCQLLHSDVISQCLCVAKFMRETIKENSSAFGSFIFS